MEDQVVTVLVQEPLNCPWLLTMVYASPKAYIREELWQYIRQLGAVVNIPWVLIGDVNQPLDSCDKRGGRPVNRHLASRLWTVLDDCNLLDMGFVGPKFTWTNGGQGGANIRERIDRAWCNLQWSQQFEGFAIRHLLRASSDHHPLRLGDPHLEGARKYLGFRFLDAWFHHPDFITKVEEFWRKEPANLSETIASFKTGIWHWNQTTFGNIFWRKKRCQARIVGVQKVLAISPRQSLYELERQLLGELDDILTQEETYWKQWARMHWLVGGERNTRFFHMSVKSRTRLNRILQLKDPNGSWCTDETQLRDMARHFYAMLYTKDPSVVSHPELWSFPRLSPRTITWLNSAVTESEIQTAMFHLGAHKALGPDGLPAEFLQRHWNWVGESVISFVTQAFRDGVVSADMNQSVICLLPKQPHPENIS